MPQKMPKAETWEPRLEALESSDCQTEVVAMMPPVPRPRMIRETMNWPREKEEHMRMAPIALKRQETQMVHLRPILSPRKVHARAPKVPNNV